MADNSVATAGTSVAAVVVTEDCRVAYGVHLLSLKKNQVIDDNQALVDYLINTGAPVKAKRKAATPKPEGEVTSDNTEGDASQSGDESEV
jgi:hypothetical protein